jgi:hypothetical protein
MLVIHAIVCVSHQIEIEFEKNHPGSTNNPKYFAAVFLRP